MKPVLLVARLLTSVARVAVRRRSLGPRHASWSLMYESVVDLIRDDMKAMGAMGDLRQMRAWREQKIQPSPLDSKVRCSATTMGGVPSTWCVPRGGHDARVVLYLHGGGYVFGSARTHADLINRIALEARARVLAPEYRLAPDHPFPAAVDDAVAVYKALLASGVRADRIVVAGDSAGGGLALSLALTLREEGVALPAALALMSPWVDLAASHASVREHGERYDYIESKGIALCAESYLGGLDPTHPIASPLYAELSGLPPMLLQVGSLEVFYGEDTAFAARAGEHGVALTLDVIEDMVHVPGLFAAVSTHAQRAMTRLGAFVQRATPG